MLNRLYIQATSCRLINYFLTAGESTFGAATAGESTFGVATAGESTFGVSTAGESTFGASVVVASSLLQAVKNATTAIAKNTFFIFFCLIFKNYNLIFIPELKKGNPLLIK